MPADNRPNIVFVCVDQWRGDCLGFAGHPVVETPHLDRLSAEGVSFSQAYSATPICVPARAAMLTGLNQRHHGFVGYDDQIDWDYEVTLPGLLADSGYQTQAVGKLHVQPARNLVGFHNVVLHDGYLHRERSKNDDPLIYDDYLPWLRDQLGKSGADYIDTGVGGGYVVRPWIYDEMLHPTSWVTSQSINFLQRRDPTKPFFLMMSFVRPHPPLDPPESFLSRYADRELPDPLMGDWVGSRELPVEGLDEPVPTVPYLIDLARRAYFAQMTHVDHQLNRMFMALFEAGVLDNTAIVFTSDHGDMLFDHNMIGKGYAFDGSVRVPLILRLPQTHDGERNHREFEQPVELRDLFPTFCDLAGVEVPEMVDGRSLLDLVRGESIGWREYVHGEYAVHSMRTRGIENNQWLSDGREKYVWYPQTGVEMLFDIEDDPGELHDRAAAKPERVAYWRAHLVDELEGREEGFVRHRELVVGRPQSPTLTNAGTYEKR